MNKSSARGSTLSSTGAFGESDDFACGMMMCQGPCPPDAKINKIKQKWWVSSTSREQNLTKVVGVPYQPGDKFNKSFGCPLPAGRKN
eukprot:3222026-Pyramimonas_sp.AAC.1